MNWRRSQPAFRIGAFLALIILGGLALRLLAVSWHALYPLSGDEEVFFEQARTFVQGGGYHDFEFMRGPLYPLFLAVIFRLFGAEISAARIVQALLSAATVPLIYLWVQRRHGTRAGLVAAALGALYFAFVVQTTVLLTEPLFLFLFALGWVLLDRGIERPAWWTSLATGALFGLATLTRSIGLPLVVLAAIGHAWGAARHRARDLPSSELAFRNSAAPADKATKRLSGRARLIVAALSVLAGAALVLLPWTARNALVHHAVILVDTTGTTNLWMDNDPLLGRDRVKAELLKYPEGERQGLAVREGIRAIAADPGRFLEKCWQEIKKFASLEYVDDFVARPAIWYPPGEVWSRILLGDALYLLILLAGLAGLAGSQTRSKGLDLLWLAYVPATTTLFHVELRYRLPFVLALLPYSAFALAHPRRVWSIQRTRPSRAVLAGLAVVVLVGILLAHANYPALSLQVTRKRLHVALGQRAMLRGDPHKAEEQARSALSVYPESAEAGVLLARALRAQGRVEEAEQALRRAIAYRSGHPHPHLLLGDLLHDQGETEEASEQLSYERTSLEDLQRWAWDNFAGPAPTALDLGSGLELGDILGWHLPERTSEGTSFRWSDERVSFRLAPPAGTGPARLTLRLAAGRPGDLPLPSAEVWLAGRLLARFPVENGWHSYTVEIEEPPAEGVLLVEVRTETFRPHQDDPYVADNRPLGAMVDWIRIMR